MNLIEPSACATGSLSAAARERLVSRRSEPLFYADWLRAVFIHYEVEAEDLQHEVPFPLELREGKAYVSLVAFTMRNLRPRIGGRLAAWFFKPIATHQFLNVRTYVCSHGEPGIYFLAEWLSNPLSVRLGPGTFGLPYRYGRFHYDRRGEDGRLRGEVVGVADRPTSENPLWQSTGDFTDVQKRVAYSGAVHPSSGFRDCETGSLGAFLMERYTAFTHHHGKYRFFRIWHSPWSQKQIELIVDDDALLMSSWSWFKQARLIGANYSPGVQDVWMGRPGKLERCSRGRRAIPFLEL